MHYVGIDLHKQSITICQVDQQGQIQARRQLSCQQPELIVACFKQWTPLPGGDGGYGQLRVALATAGAVG